MIHRTHSRHRRRGMTIVESALVISACLLFVFGIFEYGRYAMMRQLVANAAREGARYAVVHTYDKTTADVTSQVTARLGGLNNQLTNYTVTVFGSDASGNSTGSWTDASFNNYICVQVEGDYKPVLPTFLYMPSILKIKTQALMFSEAN